MVKAVFYIVVFALVSSCGHFGDTKRLLTVEEMKKHNLNGTLYEAEICPNRFDEVRKKLVVSGECEVVNCDMIGDRTICYASKKP